MNNAQIVNFSVILALLVASYAPVVMCVGRKMRKVLTMYISTFIFRALCICGAFLNGARKELVFGIALAIAIEVSLLVFMGVAKEKVEALA